MVKKPDAEFFLSSYYKEHPEVAKQVKSGKKNCPFAESSITGLSGRFRKKVIPKDAVPKEIYKER